MSCPNSSQKGQKRKGGKEGKLGCSRVLGFPLTALFSRDKFFGHRGYRTRDVSSFLIPPQCTFLGLFQAPFKLRERD